MTTAIRALPFACICAVTLTAPVLSSEAQTLDQPLRSAPPRDSNRTTQSLTLTASALGGYDDHLAPDGVAVQSLDTVDGGYTGFADMGVRYWRGKPARSFSLDGSAYMLSYSGLNIDSPVGGQVRFRANTALGRSNRIEVEQQASTDPYVAFGAFGPLRPDLGAGAGPDANPTNGLTPHRSWGSLSSVSWDWQWTPRTTLSTGYQYSRHEYVGDFGFDNRAHRALVTLQRSLARTFALTASYSYGDALAVEQTRDESWPVTDHTGLVGFEYAKQLSRTRRIEFSAGAGATHVRTVGRLALRQLEYWAPSGQASVSMDIGRTWAVAADYHRGVTMLDGITPESFLADAALLRAEGTIGSRVELSFSAGYSKGAQQLALAAGQYDAFTLAAQTRFVVARSWALTAAYNRTDYQLSGVPVLPLDPTTPEYKRNAVRVGMTYSFTLSPRAARPGRPGRTEN